MEDVKEKQDLLFYVYRVFDAFTEARTRMACERGCSFCCTRNVTLTTLEARPVLSELKKSGNLQLLNQQELLEGNLFRPEYTINDLALAFSSGKEPPEENTVRGEGFCPLLEKGQCLVYDFRPFACRSFFSLEKCRPEKGALVASSLIAVITVGQQIIEHIDSGGFFGNLTEILLWLRDETEDGGSRSGSGLDLNDFPLNKKLPGLVIQPEEAEEIQPFLSRLFNGLVNGEPFYARLDVR